MATRRKQPVIDWSSMEAAQGESAVELRSLLPLTGQGGRPDKFARFFASEKAKDVQEGCRRLQMACEFIGEIFTTRMNFHASGFRFRGSPPSEEAWLSKGMFARAWRLQMDAWMEYLLMDSAVIFWMEPEAGQIAVPVVLDSESCEFSDSLGRESLKVKVAARTLSAAQKQKIRAEFGERWVEAFEKGGSVQVGEGEGENFRVITRGRLGQGFAVPRLRQIFQRLMTKDMLAAADWGGAFTHRDIFRHLTAGYPIDSGPNAGASTHHLKEKQGKQMQANMKKKRGLVDWVTNFDVKIGWDFMDPKYFGAEKYKGTLDALRAWAGPAGRILEKEPSPYLLQAFEKEGFVERERMAILLNSVFDHPSFAPGRPRSVKNLQVGWDPFAYKDAKSMAALLQFAVSGGIMSPQTAREVLQLDDDLERSRLKEAKKDADGFKPVFEAKQGLLQNEGGRPQDKPGDQPTP